ncbi:MAG: squalene--hopene cyclase [Gemmatales bacterium]|nr:MAG: squalene--hopene cyclase [Gemmatales bacterium]
MNWRRSCCWHLAAALVFVAGMKTAFAAEGGANPTRLPPNSADEPFAERLSIRKAAEFLDHVAGRWTSQRRCGTCHTNYPYLFARPVLLEKGEISPVLKEVRGFFENRVANWDKAKPRWDTEVVATAAALAINDAFTTRKLHPLTRQALDRMWTVQRKDGAWDWLKCNWPPMEHDDYFGAVFAAVGVGLAPEHYAKEKSAQDGLARLTAYLQRTPPPDWHHKIWLLWAAQNLEHLLDSKEQKKTIEEIFALQRKDGGWSLPSLGAWKRRDGSPNDKNAPSDGYATGLVVFVLRQAGVPAEHPRLQKAVAWLKKNQRASGRWFTRSLTVDRAHYITHAGTCFAVLALKACEPKKK